MTKTLALLLAFGLYACGGGGGGADRSSLTGWKYNDPDWGGYEVQNFPGQETGPGLVLIEGGTFAMGQVEQDLMYEFKTVPRRITVASFYMDETEIANVHYREYLYWLRRVFGSDYKEVVRAATPDTNVWREELAYNEPYVEYYLRHPSYNEYPVVGVSWIQANDFAAWRTDRVNEMLMIESGILELNPNQVNEDNFNTEAYIVGQYEGLVKMNLPDLNPSGSGERRVNMSDGIMLPDYRLPTEAEWEYAALALTGNNIFVGEELVTDRKLYPWNGHSLRNPVHGSWQGSFLANFKRGRGDMMGVAGGLNDNAEITAPIHAFLPNDYGLYNMAGNVSEWVADVYRQMSSEDVEDFNSFRGNVFQSKELDEDGVPVEKDSLGRIKYQNLKDEDLVDRRNFKKADVRDYKDGDKSSSASYGYGETSLVNNQARVYKGGSWADRAYYLTCANRRHLDERLSSSQIGFRCAMIRMGSPAGNDFSSGNYFSGKK